MMSRSTAQLCIRWYLRFVLAVSLVLLVQVVCADERWQTVLAAVLQVAVIVGIMLLQRRLDRRSSRYY